MKIVHIPTGEAYQLSPDTCLEVERTNLFFNEYGEQTLPVTLPDTPLNRRLTGNPEQLANLERRLPISNVPLPTGNTSAPAARPYWEPVGTKVSQPLST